MEVYAAALIIFLDKNWDTFLKYCGSNDFADETMKALHKMAGIRDTTSARCREDGNTYDG